MFEIILADLRKDFGKKILLSPEDIAEIIDMSVGQQANLRSKEKFPIPTTKDAGRVKINIYDLAKYLADGARTHSKAEIAKLPTPLPRVEKKARKGLLEKDWWAFRQKAVISIIRKSLLTNELSDGIKNKIIIKKTTIKI